MNLERFVANRLSVDKGEGNHLSTLMSRISITSVALSVLVMICSVAILTGFKKEIKEKLIGFNSQARIVNYDSNLSFETNPITINYPVFDSLINLKEIKSTQPYILKGGIIRTNEETQGVVLKGINKDFNWKFFEKNLIKGEKFILNDSTSSNNVMFSSTLARLLKLNVGDSFEVYFVQEPVRVRKFTISGIFNTNFEEFDKNFILCDIRHLRRLNMWESDQASGIEVFFKDKYNEVSAVEKLREATIYKTLPDGSRLDVYTIENEFPHLFNWMALQDMNVVIILSLMILVSVFNLVSSFLIMLLEKISMIGILKSLGMTNLSVKKIFIYRSARIVFKGLILGNILGIGLCLLQKYFGIIQLNPENYHLTEVPISLSVSWLILLNVCSFVIILLMQILPSIVITNLSPDKTIRME